MGRNINWGEYIKHHSDMVSFQKEIAPFIPTLRELMVVWNVKSVSHAEYILKKLLKNGMVIQRGKYKQYYAVEND